MKKRETTVRTAKGQILRLSTRSSGFYEVRESTIPELVGLRGAVVGDDRLTLAAQAVAGTRPLCPSTDSRGNKAIGFAGSTATLTGRTTIKNGNRLLLFSAEGIARGLSGPLIVISAPFSSF